MLMHNAEALTREIPALCAMPASLLQLTPELAPWRAADKMLSAADETVL